MRPGTCAISSSDLRRVFARRRRERFAFNLSCRTTSSNNVEVAFGTDANANDVLDLAEIDRVVGWDCGVWFTRRGADGVRVVSDVASSNGMQTLTWLLQIGPDGQPSRLSAPRRVVRPAQGDAVTADDIAHGWRAVSSAEAEAPVAMPGGAVTNDLLRRRGGFDWAFRVEPEGWRFPWRGRPPRRDASASPRRGIVPTRSSRGPMASTSRTAACCSSSASRVHAETAHLDSIEEGLGEE